MSTGNPESNVCDQRLRATDFQKVVPLTCHGHSRPITHLSFSSVVDDGQYYLISACKGRKTPCAGDIVTDSIRQQSTIARWHHWRLDRHVHRPQGSRMVLEALIRCDYSCYGVSRLHCTGLGSTHWRVSTRFEPQSHRQGCRFPGPEQSSSRCDRRTGEEVTHLGLDAIKSGALTD